MAMLSGQIAIVTGAGRGIGRTVSKGLAVLGATVLLVGRNTSPLMEIKGEIEATGGQAETYPLDLRQGEDITAFAASVKAQHGRCDILVNNAGIGVFGKPLHETSPESWDSMMSTNLRAPYFMIRGFAPLMIEAGRGHIINISSLAGHNPLRNGAAYAASKWGLNGLTYSVAEELRDYGIRVSAIAPGSVNTDFGGSGKDGSWKIQPEDVANVVALIVTQSPQSFVSEVLLRPARKP